VEKKPDVPVGPPLGTAEVCFRRCHICPAPGSSLIRDRNHVRRKRLAIDYVREQSSPGV
jgi:hypothetical protein